MVYGLEYPHLWKELSSPRKGPRGFCGVPKVLRPCLLHKRLRLSRQEFKLHLQVAAFFARAVPSTPLPMAHEEPSEAIRYRIVKKLRDLEGSDPDGGVRVVEVRHETNLLPLAARRYFRCGE